MPKIVLLCKLSSSSAIVFNKLSEHFAIEKIIIDGKVSKKTFLKRRIKRYGFLKTFGQMLFSFLVVPILNKISRKRRKEILNQYGVDETLDGLLSQDYASFDSINSKECIELLKSISPDIVVVNGTRIISKEVLNCTNAVFINLHAGITPKYRGCHGAYWAYRNNDDENAGVTVHIVDEGIDTGNILYQSKITKTKKDNFTTYPLLQTCVGVEDEIKAIYDIINGDIKTVGNELPSCLYTHPTIFEYIYHRIRFGVK